MAITPRAGYSPAPRKAMSKRRAAAPKKNGRPSSYTEATAAEICRRVVEGQSLLTICKAPGMPDKETMEMTDEQLNARLTQLLERRRETPPPE